MAFILYLAGVLAGLALMPLANLYSMSRWYPDLKRASEYTCENLSLQTSLISAS